MTKRKWTPAELNILLTAVTKKGQIEGFKTAAKRLKRSEKGVALKYYGVKRKGITTDSIKEEKPKQVKKTKQPIDPSVIKAKLVAQGDRLIVAQKQNGTYLMIEL